MPVIFQDHLVCNIGAKEKTSREFRYSEIDIRFVSVLTHAALKGKRSFHINFFSYRTLSFVVKTSAKTSALNF